MNKGNPTIQIRLHPDVIKKAEQRAKDLGFLKSSGEGNVSDYVRNLILLDINSKSIIIDGESPRYDVK